MYRLEERGVRGRESGKLNWLVSADVGAMMCVADLEQNIDAELSHGDCAHSQWHVSGTSH
jgi:hypothetical protein